MAPPPPAPPVPSRTLNNADIAELLAALSQTAKYPAQKALRRAARRAFLWPEEAADLVATGRSLTELSGVGPYISDVIAAWLQDPPPLPTPPEIRTGFLTIPAARAILARRPSWMDALRGDLQMHSVWSDGSGTISEMAEAAVQHGYEYIAITDHAQTLRIAGGIDERQLKEQGAEIAEVNALLENVGTPLRVLHSIELNLNPQGDGDMQRSALDNLDLVLGCFHSSLRKKDDQTERYVRALRNPDIQILGHPRGRIYNFRAGLNADWPRVFAAAAELDKAVEIDSYPDRQDLSTDLVRLAAQAGCRISIGTDAHGPTQLDFIELGLASALLAGVPAERILNFMSREDLLAWANDVRQVSAP
ncbi:MAG TPA: PHP domain-containing protein [Gemmatimonadales bacterium]|nr:PHP domain-containing protein [Gemmatimonadales bacterium]